MAGWGWGWEYKVCMEVRTAPCNTDGQRGFLRISNGGIVVLVNYVGACNLLMVGPLGTLMYPDTGSLKQKLQVCKQ